MRLKIIFTIFLILSMLNIACGESDLIHWVSSSSSEITAGSQLKSSTTCGNLYMHFMDAESLEGWVKTTMVIPVTYVTVSGGDGTTGWDSSVSFRYGSLSGPEVGTGIYGYQKIGTDYHITTISWLDLDITSYTGAIDLYIANSDIQVTPKYGNIRQAASIVGLGNDDVMFYYLYPSPAQNIPFSFSKSITDIHYDYYNTYSYSAHITHNYFEMDRTVYNSTRNYVNINGTWDNETSVKSTDYSKLSTDLDNMTWDFIFTNQYGENKSLQIEFDTAPITSVGSIALNQTSYTEPELIQIDAELFTYDFTGHAYTTYLQWQDDVGNWNTVSYVEYNESIGFYTDDPTKSIIGDIDFYKYKIPLRLRAVLIDFNKNTYVSTTIAESNTVLYNPPAGALYLVTGTVVNADTDAVVTGATVSVTGPMSQSDTTNINGRFYLYLADGTYTFNTTKSGYEDNVDTGIIINSDTSGIEIPLVPVSTEEGVIYGTITDLDTNNPLNDVHVIFSNATDTIHAYSASNGYYEAEGFNNDSVYAVRALKTGYYSYNGSITTETSGATHKSFDMVQTNYSATPTPTSVSTYPGGEGYEWTNDDIVTMLRILVPGIFLMMLIFLLLAVMMGFMPNNGGNQGGNSGLGELWRRK